MDKILLQELLQSDIIDNEVLEVIETMKKKKVNEVHCYKITPPKDEKSRWQTYVKTEDGKKKVSAFSEKILYEKLYQHYFDGSEYTLKSLYPIWIQKRYDDNISDRTIKRNENHWNKYYSNDKLVNVPIKKLNADMLETFFHSCIKNYNMTVKELNNMKFICIDMFRLAKRKGFINYNIFDAVIIKTNACVPAGNKKDSSRIYLPHEKKLLFDKMNEELKSDPYNTDIYAIFLLFKLGLRIGEIVALKWDDVDFEEREIHIHSMETLTKNENGDLRPCIVPYTKKKSQYGDRYLPIADYEINLLKTVKNISEFCDYKEKNFIFCDDVGRTKIREIDNCIRKMCNQSEIEEKSSHDIRRTVASEMYNNSVPVEIIREYMGHSDIKTTYGYILDNKEKHETSKMIMNALQSMSGLVRTQKISNKK